MNSVSNQPVSRLRSIHKVGIVGAGTMGSSMAQILARYHYPVILYNHRAEKLQTAEKLIAAGVANLISAGKVTEAEGKELKERIVYTADMKELSDVDLIVENIAEVADIKKHVFAELSKIVPSDAIIATNTSGLSINMLAESVENPERFLGFHWFNPPHVIPLVEIIRNEATLDEAAQAIYDLSLAIHKKPAIVAKDVPGFAANRLQLALYREALALVEEGVVSPEDVDSVLKYGLGFRWACLGPLETMDFGGLDIFDHIAEYLMPDLCDSHEVPKLLADAVAQRHLGVKTGQGFYTYTPEEAAAKTQKRDEKLLALLKALDLE